MKTIIGLFVLASMVGCSTPIKTYENEKPKLVLEEYLNGQFTAHGIVLNRSGEATRRFKVDLDTQWTNGVGTLKELFSWNDGTTSTRIWTIKKTGDGKYEGTASDVVGVAHGETAGNAFHWNYYLNLDVDGSTYKIHFDDWMYLIDEKVLINKAVMSKFGFRVGEVIISFTKP